MGFLNFLKPKKRKGEEPLAAPELPPLPAEGELYSELPSLPEAPETSGLPEMELPPLKGLDGFELPEMEAGTKEAESLFKEWPKASKPEAKAQKIEQPELPEIPELPPFKLEDEQPLPQQLLPRPVTEAPAEMPEARPFMPEHEPIGKLISRDNKFFMSASDFRIMRESLEQMSRTQKKHHKLTEIKKEESQHYEHLNMLAEDMQRKLMLIDRTLFE